jgi:uncharacterized protein YndB with AHSA1/START domain
VEITVDLRVGGQQVAAWGPSKDALFRETQTFLEIERPHRLVTESVGSSPDGQSMTTRITVTFEPQGDGTLMSVHQTGFPAAEMRDFFVAEVWAGAMERLAVFFSRTSGGDAS